MNALERIRTRHQERIIDAFSNAFEHYEANVEFFNSTILSRSNIFDDAPTFFEYFRNFNEDNPSSTNQEIKAIKQFNSALASFQRSLGVGGDLAGHVFSHDYDMNRDELIQVLVNYIKDEISQSGLVGQHLDFTDESIKDYQNMPDIFLVGDAEGQSKLMSFKEFKKAFKDTSFEISYTDDAYHMDDGSIVFKMNSLIMGNIDHALNALVRSLKPDQAISLIIQDQEFVIFANKMNKHQAVLKSEINASMHNEISDNFMPNQSIFEAAQKSGISINDVTSSFAIASIKGFDNPYYPMVSQIELDTQMRQHIDQWLENCPTSMKKLRISVNPEDSYFTFDYAPMPFNNAVFSDGLERSERIKYQLGVLNNGVIDAMIQLGMASRVESIRRLENDYQFDVTYHEPEMDMALKPILAKINGSSYDSSLSVKAVYEYTELLGPYVEIRIKEKDSSDEEILSGVRMVEGSLFEVNLNAIDYDDPPAWSPVVGAYSKTQQTIYEQVFGIRFPLLEGSDDSEKLASAARLKADIGWKQHCNDFDVFVKTIRLDEASHFQMGDTAKQPSTTEILEKMNKTMNQWYKEGRLGTPEYDELVNQINELESSLKQDHVLGM